LLLTLEIKEITMNSLFAIGAEFLSPMHLLILLGIGVLLFGKRLPDIGRSLGKGIVEFKKGLKGLEDDVEGTSSHLPEQRAAIEPPRPPQRVQTTAPKFEDNTNSIKTPPQV
jgi:sec-independent protein translocase protein TatA